MYADKAILNENKEIMITTTKPGDIFILKCFDNLLLVIEESAIKFMCKK